MWSWGTLERLGQDFRYAIRTLRKNRGFTAVALATLAVGIGANTVIFTLVHAVLLAPLPYREPDRLVSLLALKPRWTNSMSGPDVADVRSQAAAFEDIAMTRFNSADFQGPAGPERVTGVQVTANVFSLLGVSPMAGRNFEPADDRPGAPRTIILSYAFWQRRFGGDRAAIGKSITVGKGAGGGGGGDRGRGIAGDYSRAAEHETAVSRKAGGSGDLCLRAGGAAGRGAGGVLGSSQARDEGGPGGGAPV